ncbi:MAG TPA: DUF2232 domain-containing protein, partial [Alphaproteobacteria bacterium]|nr:DUF2232 domain-containing protein [Alphaproteobacteria bacterium]
MALYYLWSAAAGIASGLLYLSPLTGNLGTVILAYIAPLPLFLGGLGLGVPAAALAGAIGAVLTGITAGAQIAGIYALSYALPVLLVSRQALLSRPTPDGGTEWYPLGHLAAWLAGLAIAYFALVTVIAGIAGNGLIAEIRDVIRTYGELLGEQGGGRLQAELDPWITSLPAIVVGSWMLTLTINGALAQGLLARFGRNLRPLADIAFMVVPWQMLPLFAVSAVAALLLGGMPGLVAKTLAAIATVPYFLHGLGVVHRRVREWLVRYLIL